MPGFLRSRELSAAPSAGLRHRAWRCCGAAPRGTSLTGDFAKSPGGLGDRPGLVCCGGGASVLSVSPTRGSWHATPGTPVKAKLLVVQWLRVWHTTLLKTPYIPPRKQSDLPSGPHRPPPPASAAAALLPPVLPPAPPLFPTRLTLFIALSSFIFFLHPLPLLWPCHPSVPPFHRPPPLFPLYLISITRFCSC